MLSLLTWRDFSGILALCTFPFHSLSLMSGVCLHGEAFLVHDNKQILLSVSVLYVGDLFIWKGFLGGTG